MSFWTRGRTSVLICSCCIKSFTLDENGSDTGIVICPNLTVIVTVSFCFSIDPWFLIPEKTQRPKEATARALSFWRERQRQWFLPKPLGSLTLGCFWCSDVLVTEIQRKFRIRWSKHDGLKISHRIAHRISSPKPSALTFLGTPRTLRATKRSTTVDELRMTMSKAIYWLSSIGGLWSRHT